MKIKLTLIAIGLATFSLAACAPTTGDNANRRTAVNATVAVPAKPEDTALIVAARGGHADTIKTLLTTPGINVNARDEAGNTPLIEAARFGHDDVVRQLLIGGADVKIKNSDSKTALTYAAQGGHKQTVELLRQAGATE